MYAACLGSSGRIVQGVELRGDVGCLGRASPPECLVRLPQAGPGVRGAAGGSRGAAKAGQGVTLIPGAVDPAGEVQSLPVALLRSV